VNAQEVCNAICQKFSDARQYEFERFRSANPDWAVTSIKSTISRLEGLLKAFGGDAT